MYKMYRNILLTAAGLLLGLASSISAHILDCEIVDYSEFPYTRTTLEMLLPVEQSHKFTGQEVRWNGVVGAVTQDDAGRLKWKYSALVQRNSGMTATISFTLIRVSGVLIIRVEPGGKTQRTNSVDAKDFQFAVRVDDLDDVNIVSVDRVTGRCS
ncbi:MAG: hypothetical protein ACI861_002456 [Paracoccaceae bacterium]|jgi:hypothetical protein